MSYTTTEEHEIVVRTSSAFAEQGVSHALKLLEGKAAQKCYTHQIQDTFEIRVTHGFGGIFEICAKATYAKIVTAVQEAEPTPEAEDEYAEHDRRKAAELGMSVESYKRGIEDL